MKIKVGIKFKTDRNTEFVVTQVTPTTVTYCSLSSNKEYTEDRKQFEKRIKLISKKWNDRNKTYKANKQAQKMREQA